MNLARRLFGPGRDEVWAQLSAEIGGQVVRVPRGSVAVQVRYGHAIVTLDAWSMNKTTRTRLRAPFFNPDGFRFSVAHEGGFLGLRLLLGLRDVEIGVPAFDQRFKLEANDPGRARALFANPRIRDLVLVQPAMDLRINDDEGSLIASNCPQGVDVLQFQAEGLLLDVALLKGLFELFSEVLQQLASAGPSQEAVDLQAPRAAALRTSRTPPKLPEAERRHLDALLAPGGQLHDTGILLWDGDPARREAALALGKLQAHAAAPHLRAALADSDPGLRSAALWALGELRDPAVTAAVIPLLADDALCGSRPVRLTAAETLEKLGEGEVAAAFLASLEGRREAVEVLRRHSGPPLFAALIRALEGQEFSRVVQAARVLGELGEGTTFQRVGERYWDFVKSTNPDPALLRLMEEAIEKLKLRASLPRPAHAPSADASQLPRPARDPKTS